MPPKYQYIDSLRGIAILLVVLLHVGQYGTELESFPALLKNVIHHGNYGVQLFFLVSSFTLMLSYESRQYEPHATRNFFLRRAFRILPMYYLFIGYYVIAQATGYGFFKNEANWSLVHWDEALANVFFVHGSRPEWINDFVPGGWSITVEMTFYLVLPLLCRVIRNLNWALILLCISLLGSKAAVLLLSGTSFDSHSFLYFFFPNQFPVFALGIVAYFLVKKPESLHASTILTLATTLFVFCYIQMPDHFLYSLVFFALLIAMAKYPYRLFSNAVLSYLGKISFSLYLVHFVVLHRLLAFDFLNYIPVTSLTTSVLNLVIRFVVVLGISAVFSHVMYHYVEVFFQNIGKEFIARHSRVTRKSTVQKSVAELV